jgi:hypothetical protein
MIADDLRTLEGRTRAVDPLLPSRAIEELDLHATRGRCDSQRQGVINVSAKRRSGTSSVLHT